MEMGQILVRNLDDQVIARLKQRARDENSSLEQSVRRILTEAARPSRMQVIEEIDALRRRIGPLPGDSTATIREHRDNNEPYR
jgi:plasmid stability protein